MRTLENKFIDTSNTEVVSFLPNGEGIPNILDHSHFILYIWINVLDRLMKLGQVTKVDGFSPEDAFINSYNGYTTRLGTKIGQWKLLFVGVFLKSSFSSNIEYDTDIRRFIDSFHYANKTDTPFHCPGLINNEEIVGLDWNNKPHRDRLYTLLRQRANVNTCDIRYKFQFKNKTQSYITQDKVLKALNEFKLTLLNAMTGYGKTTISPHIVAELCQIGDIALFTSPISDTLNGVLHNLRTRNYGKPITVFIDDDLKNKYFLHKLEEARKTSIVLLVFTVQNVRYTEDTSVPVDERGIREKFSFLNKYKLTLWIRDEYHVQYNGKVTSKILSHVRARYTLDLTATIYKMSSSTGFYKILYPDERMVLCYDCFWAWLEKKRGNVDLQHYPWVKLKEPNFSWPSLPDEVRNMCGNDPKIGYNPVKAFEVVNGQLVHASGLITQHWMMFNNKMGSDGKELSAKSNAFNVAFDTDHSPGWAYLMRLPEGTNGVTAQERNEIVKQTLNGRGINAVYYTAADFIRELDKGKPGIEILTEWYILSGKRNVVIITHEQLCTGSDLIPLISVLLYDKISSPDILLQLFGRLTREWEYSPGKWKDSTVVYLMAPGMAAQIVPSLWRGICDREPDPTKQREMWDCVAPSNYVDGKPHVWSFDEARESFHKFTVQKTLNGEVTPSFFNQFGSSLLDAIIDCEVNPLKSSSLSKKTKITEKNGSGTYTTKRQGGKKNGKKPIKDIPQFEVLAQMVMCVPEIQFAEQHSTVESLWRGRLFEIWFDKSQRDMIEKALSSKPFREYFVALMKESDKAFSEENLCETILNGKLFRPRTWLNAKGMVFMTPDWVKDNIIPLIKIKSPESICVVNSLQGVLPILLRKTFPLSKITCVEPFTDLVPLLKRIGKRMRFDVKLIDKSLNSLSKPFQLVISSPPHNTKTSKSIECFSGAGESKLWKSYYKYCMQLTEMGGILCILLPDSSIKPISIENVEVEDLRIFGRPNFDTCKCLWIIRNDKKTSHIKSNDIILNKVLDFDGSSRYHIKQQLKPNMKGKEKRCIGYGKGGFYFEISSVYYEFGEKLLFPYLTRNGGDITATKFFVDRNKSPVSANTKTDVVDINGISENEVKSIINLLTESSIGKYLNTYFRGSYSTHKVVELLRKMPVNRTLRTDTDFFEYYGFSENEKEQIEFKIR